MKNFIVLLTLFFSVGAHAEKISFECYSVNVDVFTGERGKEFHSSSIDIDTDTLIANRVIRFESSSETYKQENIQVMMMHNTYFLNYRRDNFKEPIVLSRYTNGGYRRHNYTSDLLDPETTCYRGF